MPKRAVKFARAVLAAAFFAAFGLCGAVIGYVALPALALVPGTQRRGAIRRRLVKWSYRGFLAAARAVGLLRVEIDEDSRRALANAKGCVIAANHITLIDVVVLIANLPDSTAIAKMGAAANPFYGFIVKFAFIAGKDASRILSRATDLLSEGVNVIVFPEGTRVAPDSKGRKLKRGAARSAMASGAKILPVFISCSERVLEKGQPFWEVGSGTIVWKVEAREPVDVSRLEGGRRGEIELMREISARIWPTS